MAEKPYPRGVEVQRKGNQIFSHVRKKWLVRTPEETVRQGFVTRLVNQYGFSLDQMDESVEVTGARGTGKAQADVVVWRTVEDKVAKRNPIIVVETKSDNVTITLGDYQQGANYASWARAKFFVTHNNKETKFWRPREGFLPTEFEEIEGIPRATATEKEIEELLKRLKVFNQDEFADLLHQCHNIIRNREKLDPAAAFDEIAKILFMKVYAERHMREKMGQNKFTLEFVELMEQGSKNYLQHLFDETKEAYQEDQIFALDAKINLKPNTIKEIVAKLERYNLSETSEDVKGIAFERFLGKTFRGEIGQFFTPRTIVEFMVGMMDPKEGDVICDPGSGSGGFLIRYFEIVREQILRSVDAEYQRRKAEIEAKKSLSHEEKASRLSDVYAALQETIDPRKEGSRLWNLANRCIYGCDANDRMARTSKMNMIMHGDGHGGIHYHDGFLNVNGIFDSRFDIVLTNPPFGANVEKSDVILDSQVEILPSVERRYLREYGEAYKEAMARVRAAKGKPILSLFELPRGHKVKTEILFIERCLALLKPGGRMGIVLPEGIYNNPTLAYVREFVEDRARVLAVISLPQETFYSSGATVKASLLFLQKFTRQERIKYERTRIATQEEMEKKYAEEIERRIAELNKAIKQAKNREVRKEAQKALRDYERKMREKKATETRQLLKERFSYPIFLSEAEHVGITATGQPDTNELPQILEAYREFRRDPEAFTRKVQNQKMEDA